MSIPSAPSRCTASRIRNSVSPNNCPFPLLAISCAKYRTVACALADKTSAIRPASSACSGVNSITGNARMISSSLDHQPAAKSHSVETFRLAKNHSTPEAEKSYLLL